MNRCIDTDYSLRRHTPVYEFHREKLVSLETALAHLQSHIDSLPRYIRRAKRHCYYPSEHGLTRDESASIYLYTMEWGERTLHRLLDRALEDENRSALQIWFPFLKLFDTALNKLPTAKGNLWRGATGKIGKNFTRDQKVTWRGFKSCSTSMNAIKGSLGDDKTSTMFMIEAMHGREVSKYTESEHEEAILPMGVYFRVQSDPFVSDSLSDAVHLVEIDAADLSEQPVADIHSSKNQNQLLGSRRRTHLLEMETPRWTLDARTVAGGKGRGQRLNQLYYPHGICFDQNRALLIADHDNHRIMRCDPETNTMTIAAGGNGEGWGINQLYCPMDLLVDKRDHSIIIADRVSKRVVRWFDVSRKKDPQVLINNIQCAGLAMDRDGSLYVSDFHNHEVRRWRDDEEEGTLVAGGNGRGDRLDQLHWPQYLFVDDEQSVFVSDQANQRVVKWQRGAREGTVVAGGNGEGDGLNQFDNPHAVLVDRWGQIYVADQGNDRVMFWRVEASEGEIAAGGHGEGKRSNQLHRPVGLAMDDEGNLYVADLGNHRIQKFHLIPS